jgi:hypothetical protein
MNKIYFLFLITLTSYSCKKEKEIDEGSKNTEIKNTWSKPDRSWNTNLDIRHAFTSENLIYLVATNRLLVIDSDLNLIQSTPLLHKSTAHHLHRPKNNQQFIVQVNENMKSIFVFDFKHPQLNLKIDISPINAVSGLTDKNELVIGLKTHKSIKVSITELGNTLQYKVDTIESNRSFSRVSTIGNNHFVNYYEEWTTRYNSLEGFVPFSKKHLVSEMIELNDTIFASLYWTSITDDGLVYSVDGGNNWIHLIKGLRLDYFRIHKVHNELWFSFYREVFKLNLDFSKNQYTFAMVDNVGLLPSQNQVEINALFSIGSNTFAFTGDGLYLKQE